MVEGMEVVIFCHFWKNEAFLIWGKSREIPGTGWAGLAGLAGWAGHSGSSMSLRTFGRLGSLLSVRALGFWPAGCSLSSWAAHERP